MSWIFGSSPVVPAPALATAAEVVDIRARVTTTEERNVELLARVVAAEERNVELLARVVAAEERLVSLGAEVVELRGLRTSAWRAQHRQGCQT
jgi:ribosomal protein L4